MNAFQKRAIQEGQGTKNQKAKNWIKSHLFLSILALLLGFLTLKGVVGAIQMGNPFSVKQIFISAVGEAVKMDNYKHTNILLIGIGGLGHDGENLTDTLMVASLNYKDNVVSMLSIPRDFYVENEAVGWGTRINSIYEYVLDETGNPDEAMNELRKEVENMLDIELHYYAKIDFQGFVDVVDAVDGISVEVEESILDQAYPTPYGSDTLYETFYLEAGIQNLDGETALKYVRSRHNSSDFDRARRQQEVLAALKEKAFSLGVLANPNKIKDLYSALTQNFESDMSLAEMLNLLGFAQELTGDSIVSAVLNDEANKMGGFLYTPPREEGDPFYLTPYSGNLEELRLFAQLFFYHPDIYRDQIPIEILNGTKEESLAGLTKMLLVRYGFNVVAYGNATRNKLQNTQIIPLETETNAQKLEETLEILPSLVHGDIVRNVPEEYLPENWQTEAEILLELGEDFAQYYKEHDELFYLGVY